MELRELLDSGLLETYVLGQCTLEEVQLVEGLLAQHPEARAEKDAIEQALERLATAAAVTPPEGLKNRILERMKALDAVPDGPSTDNATPQRSGIRWATGLAIALALGALYLFFENTRQQRALQEQATALRSCLDREDERQALQQQVALLADPATRPVELRWASAGHPEAVAHVYVNEVRRVALLAGTALPALPADQDYQLWVIADGDANPRPLKVISADDRRLLEQQTFYDRPVAYAISVEPKGGSPSGKPTTVVMLGTVKG